MTYTPNTPQPNQTFASTQPEIQNNFSFIQEKLRTDHTFNGLGTIEEGTHLHCRMPGRSSPPSVSLTGINGAYYVDNSTPGNAQFYDGTNSYKMNMWRDIITGTVTFTATETPTPIGVPVGALPNQVFGICYFYGPTSGVSATNVVGTQTVFFTSLNLVKAWDVINSNTQIALAYDASINDVTAGCYSENQLGTYFWTLVYRNRT